MKIEIGEKIRPYSHTPGTRAVVPGSDWILQLFPTLIRIEGLSDYPIGVTGPLKEFTVQADLEKRALLVWGIAQEGYFKLRLEAIEAGLTLTVERAPKEGIRIGEKLMQRHERRLLAEGGKAYAPKTLEKLSLGSFKAQDWDQAWRRKDLKEIAPVLFLLGQLTPNVGPTTSSLPLGPLLQAYFSDLFVPRLEDDQFQGITAQKLNGNPLALYPFGYQLLRSFLIVEKNPIIEILPALPKEWDAGRALNLTIEGLGSIDLEWSKRLPRRMLFHPKAKGNATIVFPNTIASYRLNGKRIENGTPLLFELGNRYEFDRFHK